MEILSNIGRFVQKKGWYNRIFFNIECFMLICCKYAADFVLCLLLPVLKKVELFSYEQYCK